MDLLFNEGQAKEALEEHRKAEREFDGIETSKKALQNSTASPTKLNLQGRLKSDFRVFLTLIWRHLKLPDPTPLQLSIAWWLQHGGFSRLVIMAFRGAAKSWITAAFALWTLYVDPHKKVMVVSGSAKRAVNFTNFCLALIMQVPVLQHLQPKSNQRQSSTSFDVGPALPDQTPSLFAAGITGQIVGNRGDLIIGDDVETNTNALTTSMREKLADAVREFDAILKPGGQIVFLGTPQTESSIYNLLTARGYVIRIWPARYPTPDQRKKYGDRLSPYIALKLDKNPSLKTTPTEPSRFPEDDLFKRELSWGKAGFALQYMLDTSLSDANKFPLKLNNLIVAGLDPRMGFDSIAWGDGEHLVQQHLPCMGHDGDKFYRPSAVSETVSKYNSIKAFIDPSGKGADETSLAIGGELHGMVYLLAVKGWQDGFGEETLTAIANLMVSFRVNELVIEEDFGGGTFAALLKPYIIKAWADHNKATKRIEEQGGTAITPELAKKIQKELRIIDIMEPVLDQHRLVVSTEVIRSDYEDTIARDGEDLRDRYSMIHQMSHLTRVKDCLDKDDRLEAVSGLVRQFQEVIGVSPQSAAAAADEARIEEELQKLFDDADEVSGRKSRKRPGGARLHNHKATR